MVSIAATFMLLGWFVAVCARKLLSASTRSSLAWPSWLRYFAFGVGTQSVLTGSLSLFAVIPFGVVGLSNLETTEGVLLLWLPWLYLGLLLVSRKKTLIVFLRRFGLTRSNDITRRAFSRYLRGRFRLLTLDDRKFAAVPFRLRDAGAALSVAALTGMLFVTASQKSCARGIADSKSSDVYTSFGEGLLYDLLGSLNSSLATLMATVATTGVVIAIGLMWWSRRTLSIRTEVELFRLSWMVRRLGSRLWSPSLTNPAIVVARVAHDEWQRAVQTLIRTGAPVLIDVSRPGAGLLWEVAELAKNKVPMTLVAESRELLKWQHAPHDQQAQQLLDAIGGRPILEYDASRPGAAQDLAAQLRLHLPGATGLTRWFLLAPITFVVYLVLTISLMPWPQPVADWVNDLSRRFTGHILIF